MVKIKRSASTTISIITMLIVGAFLTLYSSYDGSSFMAIVGIAIVFWSTILFYIKPIKHVPLFLLQSLANSGVGNIERILLELGITEKGIYLPPRYLKSMESSLIFVPNRVGAELPLSTGITEKLFPKLNNGILVTPPGLMLSLLFEKEANISFMKADFKYLQLNFSKLFIEDLEIAESIELSERGNLITIDVVGSIFSGICEQTNSHPCTHAQVGCILSSALACVLAKTMGKPIVIKNETINSQTKTTTIDFLILETDPALAIESPIRITLN